MECYFHSTLWQFLAHEPSKSSKYGVPRGIRTPVTAVKGRRMFHVKQGVGNAGVLLLSYSNKEKPQ